MLIVQLSSAYRHERTHCGRRAHASKLQFTLIDESKEIFMKQRKTRYGPCYFCICTACTRFYCPFKIKDDRECYSCRGHGTNRPRLDCDYFEHYMKTHTFRFKRVNSFEDIQKTYMLSSARGFFMGDLDHLENLQKRLGGRITLVNVIDKFLND